MIKKGLLIVTVIILALNIAGCNKLSSKKEQQIKDVMTEYEESVLKVGKQIEELSEYFDKIEGFEETYNKYDNMFMELVEIERELKAEYDKNKETFTDETADEFIKKYEEPMKKADDYYIIVTDFIKTLEEK